MIPEKLRVKDYCYSVEMLPKGGGLFTGCRDSLGFWDANKNLKQCWNDLESCTSMAIDGDYCFTFAQKDSKVHLGRINWRDHGKRFLTLKVCQNTSATRGLDVYNGKVATYRDDKSYVKLFNISIASIRDVRRIHPPIKHGVNGLCFMLDDSLLVCDTKADTLIRYNAEEKKLIWKLSLLNPSSITTNSDGLIFVCTLTKRQIYVIRPEGMTIITLSD